MADAWKGKVEEMMRDAWKLAAVDNVEAAEGCARQGTRRRSGRNTGGRDERNSAFEEQEIGRAGARGRRRETYRGLHRRLVLLQEVRVAGVLENGGAGRRIAGQANVEVGEDGSAQRAAARSRARPWMGLLRDRVVEGRKGSDGGRVDCAFENNYPFFSARVPSLPNHPPPR
eukprot:2007440-Pleurochrysis_carterae.AAC.1